MLQIRNVLPFPKQSVLKLNFNLKSNKPWQKQNLCFFFIYFSAFYISWMCNPTKIISLLLIVRLHARENSFLDFQGRSEKYWYSLFFNKKFKYLIPFRLLFKYWYTIFANSKIKQLTYQDEAINNIYFYLTN